MSSVRYVVDGRQKNNLEKSVSESAPPSYCILCLLNIVDEKLFGIFILCVLQSILLFCLL